MAWSGSSIWGSSLGDLVGFFLFEGGFGIGVLGLMEVSGVKGSDDFLELVGVKEKNLPLKAIASATLEIGHEEEEKRRNALRSEKEEKIEKRRI